MEIWTLVENVLPFLVVGVIVAVVIGYFMSRR